MYCMLSNRHTHIPASTQPSMLCLLSLVTEYYVRGVKGYVCVIRSIPLSPPSLITQIETQIRKQFMFICLCSAARHTAHTSVSFRKTALTHSLLPNPMCLNQTLWVNPLCATAELSRPDLILNGLTEEGWIMLYTWFIRQGYLSQIWSSSLCKEAH